MSESTFHTQDRDAPLAFGWGFVEMGDVRSVPAQVDCSQGLDPSAEAELVFRAGDNAMVIVAMFRLPAGEKRFAAYLSPQKKGQPWPLPGAAAFAPHVLAPRQVPAAWRHRAEHGPAEVKPPRGHWVKHAWRGGGLGLVVVYRLYRGDPLAEPLFRWVVENLRVVPAAWRLTPPVPRVLRHHDELTGPDDMSGGHDPADLYGDDDQHDDEIAGPDDEGLDMAPHDRPLDQHEQDQLFENYFKGWDTLQLPDDARPQKAIKALRQAVEQIRPGYADMKPIARQNLAVYFGTVWGQTVCRELGWEWCALTRAGAEEFLAIVSPDRAYAMSPVGYLEGQLSPGSENSVALLFNMLRAGKLPPARPGGYRMLG